MALGEPVACAAVPAAGPGRLAKRAAIMIGRYTHAHQFRRARRELKFLLSRMMRPSRVPFAAKSKATRHSKTALARCTHVGANLSGLIKWQNPLDDKSGIPVVIVSRGSKTKIAISVLRWLGPRLRSPWATAADTLGVSNITSISWATMVSMCSTLVGVSYGRKLVTA
jgi:hypothetical protein